jgi:hypothetical protein
MLLGLPDRRQPDRSRPMQAKFNAAWSPTSVEESLDHGKCSRLELLMIAQGLGDEFSKVVEGFDGGFGDAHLKFGSGASEVDNRPLHAIGS